MTVPSFIGNIPLGAINEHMIKLIIMLLQPIIGKTIPESSIPKIIEVFKFINEQNGGNMSIADILGGLNADHITMIMSCIDNPKNSNKIGESIGICPHCKHVAEVKNFAPELFKEK